MTVSLVSIIQKEMPLLARHQGVWEGTYRFVTPQLELLDQYDFRIRVSFPDDEQGGITYRQESHYTWADGREQQLDFEALYTGNGRVEFSGRLSGFMYELDDRNIYLNFCFPDQPGVDVCEMIQLAPNNNDRARTWHWFRDNKLFQLTLVDEHRVA
jgi:hypothetical protein